MIPFPAAIVESLAINLCDCPSHPWVSSPKISAESKPPRRRSDFCPFHVCLLAAAFFCCCLLLLAKPGRSTLDTKEVFFFDKFFLLEPLAPTASVTGALFQDPPLPQFSGTPVTLPPPPKAKVQPPQLPTGLHHQHCSLLHNILQHTATLCSQCVHVKHPLSAWATFSALDVHVLPDRAVTVETSLAPVHLCTGNCFLQGSRPR